MGCGGSKTKQNEPVKEDTASKDRAAEQQQQPATVAKEKTPAAVDKSAEHKKLEKEHNETVTKLNNAQVEIDALKKQLEAKKTKEVEAARSTTIPGGVSFEVVVTAAEIAELRGIDGVGLYYVQGEAKPLEERENVVIVSCKKELVTKVVETIKCAPDIKRRPKPVPDAPPPPVEKPVEAVPEEDLEGGEKEKEKEKKVKLAVPDQTVKASTDIDLSEAWDGAVPLAFQWVDEPSPYSEYNDPSGNNWSCFTNIRKAPGKPQKVSLEWRQGMTGVWSEIPADEKYAATMTLKPAKVEGSAYRGFQSRWIVDGDKYVSPLQLAPTLQSKLMTYPAVRSAIKALPPGKQSIDNIEQENLRKALMTVENIIPMNTWDIDFSVTKIPGAYLNGEQVMTVFEKAEMIAKLKSADPSIQAEVRKTILKSPIMAANAAAGTVGVKLDLIIKNMDFFLPKMTDPDFDKLQSIEEKEELWETLRREMQVDVNELYPSFQNGIRVTFPPAQVLRNAMRTKRPVASTEIKMPVKLSFKLDDDKIYIEKKEVSFVVWKDGSDYETAKQVVVLEAPEEKEKFGIKREEKSVWKNYVGSIELVPSVYRYHWTYDGQPYFNNGCPYGEAFKPGTSYQTFSVFCRVQFGIGVAF